MAQVALETESTLTDRFQTTVPSPVRQALHLGKKDKIKYAIQSDGSVVISRAEAQGRNLSCNCNKICCYKRLNCHP